MGALAACGLAAAAPEPPPHLDHAVEIRIARGNIASSGDYPWMGALVDAATADEKDGAFCGGTLIHPRWVLTAAHCVEGMRPSEVDFWTGSTDLSDYSSRRLPVLDIRIHPGYNTHTLEHDLALLLLPEVEELRDAPVISLAPDASHEAPGTVARGIGWGALEDGSYDEHLRWADIPIVSNATAAEVHTDITAEMLFAGYRSSGPNTCTGDSGGPLVVPAPGDGWWQVGVVSFGRGDLDCDAPENYGAYTRLSSYLDWIWPNVRPEQLAWEAHHGIAADESDTDGDGLSAFAEFAYGTDPVKADQPAWETTVHADDGAPYASLSFDAKTSFEIDWRLLESTDLEDWSDTGTPVAQIEGSSASPHTVRLGDFPATETRFYRPEPRPSIGYPDSDHPVGLPGYAYCALHEDSGNPVGMRFAAQGDSSTGGAWLLSVRSNEIAPAVTFEGSPSVTLVSEDSHSAVYSLNLAPSEDLAFRVGGGAAGEYQVALYRPITPSTPLAHNRSTSGALQTSDLQIEAGSSDIYYDLHFLQGPGTFLAVKMESGAVDAFLELVDLETGLVLAASDDGFASGTNAYLDFVIPAEELLGYTVLRARSYEGAETGSYTLGVVEGDAIAVGAGERSASLNSLDPLDPNFTSADYYRQDFLLEGWVPDDPVTITLRSSQIDGMIFLLEGTTGQVLDSADSFAHGETERLTFTPEAGNSYRVRVTTYDELDTGTFYLRVE